MSDFTPVSWQCASPNASLTDCSYIPGNPDFSGIGVRVAFYVQSFTNGLLVVFSPRESVPIAWAGTLLTVSIVVAGIVGKFTKALTLHHAVLIMNFATLSCVSSLATSPKLPIWRMSPNEYFHMHRQRFEDDGNEDRERELRDEDVYINVHKTQIKREQKHGRSIIASAILLQTVFQWAWCIILFVSPEYGSCECNARTRLVIFGFPFHTESINSFDAKGVGAWFLVWPLWILVCLASTMGLVIFLSITAPASAQGTSQFSSNVLASGIRTAHTPVMVTLTRALRSWATTRTWKDHGVGLVVDCAAFILWAGLIASSEWQRKLNHVEVSENYIGGFGQITALLLACAPLWSLRTAFWKYVAYLRKEEHKNQQLQQATDAGGAEIAQPGATVLLGPSISRVHGRTPRASMNGTPSSGSDEAYEMRNVAHFSSPALLQSPESPPWTRAGFAREEVPLMGHRIDGSESSIASRTLASSSFANHRYRM